MTRRALSFVTELCDFDAPFGDRVDIGKRQVQSIHIPHFVNKIISDFNEQPACHIRKVVIGYCFAAYVLRYALTDTTLVPNGFSLSFRGFSFISCSESGDNRAYCFESERTG